MTLQLISHYDPLGRAWCVRIHDDEKFVEDTLTDKQLIDSSFNPRFVQIAFMDELCERWYIYHGTRIEAIKESDAVEWIVRYVNNNVEIRDQQESRPDIPVDRIQATETTGDVVRDPSD